MAEYCPCPTCHQYSHSIGEDRITAAFLHFQSMADHRGDGIPTQNAFDEQTQDHAQVLVAEITRLRAERNAVIRECAGVIGTMGPEWMREYDDFTLNAFTRKDTKSAILALIEGDE